MEKIDLCGSWKMMKAGEKKQTEALVPGSVYSDLLHSDLMEDPFYREHEHSALLLSEYDHQYMRSFFVSVDFLRHTKKVLVCEGLDTLSEIYINGSYVASTDNMHRTYMIDVSDHLAAGPNSICIIFHSPVKYIRDKQKQLPLANSSDALEGISHLRKAHYMSGWDWGPKLPDMGIWRDISIIGYSKAKIRDIMIHQEHMADGVGLDIEVSIDGTDLSGLHWEVSIADPEGMELQEKSVFESPSSGTRVHISDPQLWWPNNMGRQPLYSLTVFLKEKKDILDKRTLRIGLRTITVNRQEDEWGRSFAFEINGTGFFAMGANYIPEDNILSRCSREKTNKLLKDCVTANFNFIRVWGGGYYPDDYFFDLCDEYGLVVWQDLMFACGVYDLNEDLEYNVTQEVIDNVRRIRHHASLGLLCGNNEQEWGWVEWGWSGRFSEKMKKAYTRQFEVLFPDIIKKEAPDVFYWPSSPSSSGGFNDPNSENFGDMHYWGVWHKKEPFTYYRKIYPRFMSEFGIQSFPCIKTIESFTVENDRNIFSPVMESHQKNGTGNEKILYYISQNFRYPKDLDSLSFTSQLNQANGLRYGVEHWRRNRPRCMGAVYWQLNDCWPAASWSGIDYFGRWKALHYFAKRFFAPILASACEEGTRVSLHISNESKTDISGIMYWRILSHNSSILSEGKEFAEVEKLSSLEIVSLDFSLLLDTEHKKRTSYLEFKFCIYDKTISRGTVLFVPEKHFEFTDPEIAFTLLEKDGNCMLRLRSKSFARFVEVSVADHDIVFSDNYFDMSADEEKEIFFELCADPVISVRSLFDTFN